VSTIYRKTDKGHAEIETRAHRLAPRLRSALILVDGHKSDDALRKLILQQPDETLQALLEQGFIEAVEAVAPRPAARPAAVAPHARDINVLRRDAVRALTDHIGPDAEMLALKMEKAGTLEQLMPLLSLAQQAIRMARGAAAAEAFGARFLGASSAG